MAKQKTSKNSSNYKLDPKKIYDEVITQIDSIRSHVNISSQENVRLFNEIFSQDNPDVASLLTNVIKSTTLQESRAHAFYRLIGFPVISDPKNGDVLFYNPGYDIANPDPSYKYKIAAKQNSELAKLSLFREHYYNTNIASIFSQKTIDASVLSLMSINIRDFEYIQSSEPLDDDRHNQSYPAQQLNEDAPGQPLYTLYTDENGNLSSTDLTFDRYHVIKPFVTDPRIDLTVIPSTSRVCVPFLLNKSQSKLREGVFLKQPFIEKVIRDRFSVFDQESALGEAEKSILQEIKNYNLDDNELVKSISEGDYYKLNDQTRFLKYLDVITAMCTLLNDSLNQIGYAQSNYHWIPIPPSNGPEGSCQTAPIYIKDPNNLNLDEDKYLAKMQIMSTFKTTDVSTTSSGASDPGGFFFEGLTSFLNPDQNEYTGNVLKEELDKMSKQRNSVCNAANSALKNVEMIMGEFSGLGLCDIIAITAALYTVEKTVLLGLLDGPAFMRMLQVVANSSDLQTIDVSSKPDIETALTKLTETVQQYYSIMAKTLDNIKNNISA